MSDPTSEPPDSPRDISAQAQAALSKGKDQGRKALEWLQSISPRILKLAKALRITSYVGMVAAAIVVLMLLAEWWAPNLVTVIGLVVILVVLAAGPFVLFGFSGSVQALGELPDVVANSPEMYRNHQQELAKLYTDVGDPATGRARGVGRGVIGGLKLIWRIRNELPDVPGIIALARVSLFLFAIGGLVMCLVNVALIPFVGLIALIA